LCLTCWTRHWRQHPDVRERERGKYRAYNRSEHGRLARRHYNALRATQLRKWLDNLRRREEREGIWHPLPSGYYEKVFEVFESRCARCHTAEKLELDHHMPLEAGYPMLGNAVVLCRSCNGRKHCRFPVRFYDRWTLVAIEVRLWELREWLREQGVEVPC
jgi:hypothetical protein